MTVPRLWEKMEERITAIGAQTTGVKRKLADWAKSISPQGNYIIIQVHMHKSMVARRHLCGEWQRN